MWHLTCDTWHVTPDTWHLTYVGSWTFSQNFSFLAQMVWEWMLVNDIFTKDDLLNYKITPDDACDLWLIFFYFFIFLFLVLTMVIWIFLKKFIMIIIIIIKSNCTRNLNIIRKIFGINNIIQKILPGVLELCPCSKGRDFTPFSSVENCTYAPVTQNTSKLEGNAYGAQNWPAVGCWRLWVQVSVIQ